MAGVAFALSAPLYQRTIAIAPSAHSLCYRDERVPADRLYPRTGYCVTQIDDKVSLPCVCVPRPVTRGEIDRR